MEMMPMATNSNASTAVDRGRLTKCSSDERRSMTSSIEPMDYMTPNVGVVWHDPVCRGMSARWKDCASSSVPANQLRTSRFMANDARNSKCCRNDTEDENHDTVHFSCTGRHHCKADQMNRCANRQGALASQRSERAASVAFWFLSCPSCNHTFDMSGGRQTAKLAGGRPLYRGVQASAGTSARRSPCGTSTEGRGRHPRN